MHQTHERKTRLAEGFSVKLDGKPTRNFLPISVLVQQQAQARQSCKRRTRAKREQSWKKENGNDAI